MAVARRTPLSRIERQAYHRTELPNGLRILSAPRPEAESVSIGFWMGVGGRYESARVGGISHFLEHLLFKGTRARSSRQIKEAIEGSGGSINAFTDEEFTCALAKVQPKNLDVAVEILSDMVRRPRMEPKEVERERSVVLEEIRMYRDLPTQFVQEMLNNLLWPNHPLGRDVAGTPESLRRIRRKDLVAFQRRFYAPRNIVVAACGRLSHRELVEQVTRLWRSAPPGRRPVCQRAVQRQRKPRLRVQAKETEQTHFSLGFHAFPRDHPQVHALSLLNVVLGGNMSSRLFQRVREERGLAYEIGSQVKRFRDTGLFSVSAGVEHKHLAPCLRVVLKELARVRRERVSPKEFEQTAEYLTGQILFALEDTMEHMCWIGESEMLLGRVEPVEVILGQIAQVRR
ncbi:MAG: insulinase family protein [Candidatus Omnitrophica bacterium]|nr:insulinase family protein [Candidatus Omnitrophota bacterium]